MKKSNMLLTVAIILLTMVTGCSDISQKSNEDEVLGMNLMKKSAEFYKRADNYAIEQKMNLAIGYFSQSEKPEYKVMGVNMNIDTTIFNKPYKFKSEGISNYNENPSEGEKRIFPECVDILHYGVAEGNNVTVYQIMNEQWYKSALERKMFIDKDTQGTNYVTDYESYVKDVVKVTEETEDGIEAYKVQFTLRDEYLIEMFDQYGYMVLVDNVEEKDRNKKIIDIMSPIVYEVWFNKSNDSVIKTYMNVNPALETIGKLYAEYIEQYVEERQQENTIDKQDIINMYKNAIIDNTLYYKNVNKCENFDIPKEALEAPGM